MFWKSLKKTENKANFGTTAKKIVELVGEPSYTSGDHMWKGAAATLKKKATAIQIKDFSIRKFKVKSSWLTAANSKEKFPKLVVPVQPYKRDTPKRNNAEENEPKIKYFKPASVENEEFLWDAAKTYKHKLCISKARYREIKS